MGSTIQIDEARAKAWIKEVYLEISQVERVLDQVSQLQMELPGSDDSITSMIRTTAQQTDAVWKAMGKGFKDTCEAIENGIDLYAKGGRIVLDSITELGQEILRRHN